MTQEIRRSGTTAIHHGERRGTTWRTTCGVRWPDWDNSRTPREWRGGGDVRALTECGRCFPVTYTMMRWRSSHAIHLVTGGSTTPLCGAGAYPHPDTDPRMGADAEQWITGGDRGFTRCAECYRISGTALPPAEPVIYQCTAQRGHPSGNHYHGREPGSRTPWDEHDRLTHSSRPVSSIGNERHTDPDGQPYRFSSTSTTPVPRHNLVTPTERGNTMIEVTDTVDLHPLTEDTLREHPAFTLHSKEGDVDLASGTITFGCQSWTLSTLAEAGATIHFVDGGATVDMPATATQGGYVQVGDRRLSRGDVNSYTTRITPRTAPEPVVTAVVMEHGYYGCSAHDREILHLTEVNGYDQMCRLGTDADHRPSGWLMNRAGLVHFSMCRPVVGSTTEATMNGRTAERRFSLVPATPEQIAHMRTPTSHDDRGTRHFGDATQITRCDRTGTPVTTAIPWVTWGTRGTNHILRPGSDRAMLCGSNAYGDRVSPPTPGEGRNCRDCERMHQR